MLYLVQQNTWTYVRKKTNSKPITYISEFKIKDSTGSQSGVIFKARCCIKGERQVAFHDFD